MEKAQIGKYSSQVGKWEKTREMERPTWETKGHKSGNGTIQTCNSNKSGKYSSQVGKWETKLGKWKGPNGKQKVTSREMGKLNSNKSGNGKSPNRKI